MKINIFDPDLPLWRWVLNIPHMIALSFLWFVTSLPIITFVPATVALYDAIVKNMKPEIKGMYRRFFQTFKAELKRGIPMSLLWAGIAGLFLVGSYLLALISDTSEIWAFCTLIYPLMHIPPLLIFVWAIGIEARFVCSFRKLHENAFGILLLNKLKSLLILGIMVACYCACWILPALLSMLPALIVVLASIPMEQVLLPYCEQYEEN